MRITRCWQLWAIALQMASAAWSSPVEHVPPGCLPLGKLAVLEAKYLGSGNSDESRLFFRGAGSSLWYFSAVETGFDKSLRVVLPRTGSLLSEVEYFFTAPGPNGQAESSQTFTTRVATPAVCEAEGLASAATVDTASLTIGLPEYGIPPVPEGFLEQGIDHVLLPDGEDRGMALARSPGGTMQKTPKADVVAAGNGPTIQQPKKKGGSMGLVLGGVAGAAVLGAAAGGGGGGGGGSSTPTTQPPPPPAPTTFSLTFVLGQGDAPCTGKNFPDTDRDESLRLVVDSTSRCTTGYGTSCTVTLVLGAGAHSIRADFAGGIAGDTTSLFSVRVTVPSNAQFTPTGQGWTTGPTLCGQTSVNSPLSSSFSLSAR